VLTVALLSITFISKKIYCGIIAMRITSKGQVTIPRDIRQRVGLLPHTEVEFVVEGDTVIVRKIALNSRNPVRGQRIVDALRGTATRKLTTDEIMALTRGE
jgi:AbrB family looped-hinge helix DNA binding protein